MRGGGPLTGDEEQRWRSGVFWYDQGDAAAWVDAAVEGHGGEARASATVRRRKRGENDKDPCPYL